MSQSPKKVAAWQEAHPSLKIPEDALATAGPWPSLEVSDFLVWARNQDAIPAHVVKLVEELAAELRWAYDGWTKSLATDAHALLIDLFHNATGSDQYNFTRQFLQDYAKAHGYFIEPPQDETPPPWRQASESGGYVPPQPPGLSEEMIEAGNVKPPTAKKKNA